MYGEAEERDLYDIALRVGADVPFCLKGGLCRVQGVGEALTPLRLGAQLHLALARPPAGRVHGEAVPRADAAAAPAGYGGRARCARSGGCAPHWRRGLYNALEGPATALVPEIGLLRERLLALGASARA